MLSTQDRLTATSRQFLQKMDAKHLTYDKETVTTFALNSLVLVQRRGDPPTRLHTKWMGPMKILRNQNLEYHFLDLITGKEKIFHVTSLKKFHFDPQFNNPTDVARRDYLEFFVEKIIDHRGNFRQLSTLFFLTKWLGYDDSYNTWEPWANLRKLAPLHSYLRWANLSQLIPKEFRQ